MMAQATVREPGLWDRLVNDKFGGVQPVLPGEESIAAARRLYRHAMGKAFPGEVRLTSGNRYTWVKRRVLCVNPDRLSFRVRGLRSLIHDLSHYCHQRLHPEDAPHSSRQAYLERDLVDYAIRSGFLDGALRRKPGPAPKPKVEPVKPDKVQQRYQRMVNRRDKYAAELARAQRLLVKAEREVKAYERRHKGRLVKPDAAAAAT